MPHALWTTDEPVELQVNGSGPFGLNYIDPADDPSRSAGARVRGAARDQVSPATKARIR